MAFINTNMSGHNRLEFNDGPGLRVINFYELCMYLYRIFNDYSKQLLCVQHFSLYSLLCVPGYIVTVNTTFLYLNVCLQIVGSLMEVLRGSVISFIGNNAERREGGALFMQDFGQIKLYSNSSLNFINNTGRYVTPQCPLLT